MSMVVGERVTVANGQTWVVVDKIQRRQSCGFWFNPTYATHDTFWPGGYPWLMDANRRAEATKLFNGGILLLCKQEEVDAVEVNEFGPISP